jgi:hypothetical protein
VGKIEGEGVVGREREKVWKGEREREKEGGRKEEKGERRDGDEEEEGGKEVRATGGRRGTRVEVQRCKNALQCIKT